jgi:hypothetical protein
MRDENRSSRSCVIFMSSQRDAQRALVDEYDFIFVEMLVCRNSVSRADCPPDFEPMQGNAPDTALIRGGSMIVSPFGEVLAGPLEGREGLVAATIDLKEIARSKFDLDVAGHYARPDVFGLTVDLAPKCAVFTENATEQSPVSTSPELTQATRPRG